MIAFTGVINSAEHNECAVESMSVKIDEQTWKQISARLTNPEALNVLHEVVDYAIAIKIKDRWSEVI
jgi:hypothetical protein